MTDPYTTPSAAVRDLPAEKGSAAKAVALGVLASVGGAYLGNVLLLSVYVLVLFDQGADKTQAFDALMGLRIFSWLGITGIIVSMAFSVLGGYASARIAKHAEYKIGAIVAAIALALSLFIGIWRYHDWVKAGVAVASLVCVFVGVRLGIVKNRE